MINSLSAVIERSMIIAIGGLSRSGKSFLARGLQSMFEDAGKTVNLLPQDEFVYPESAIPMIRGHIDWERPESIDFERYIGAIKKSAGLSDITIVEGLMVYWEPALYNLFTCRIFIELDRDEFIRRKRRDLRWGREPGWYIEYIWDAYLIYGQVPANQEPDIYLDGNMGFDITDVYSRIAH